MQDHEPDNCCLVSRGLQMCRAPSGGLTCERTGDHDSTLQVVGREAAALTAPGKGMSARSPGTRPPQPGGRGARNQGVVLTGRVRQAPGDLRSPPPHAHTQSRPQRLGALEATSLHVPISPSPAGSPARSKVWGEPHGTQQSACPNSYPNQDPSSRGTGQVPSQDWVGVVAWGLWGERRE